MPNFPIVDSHVHLYDVKMLSYGWLESVPKINRTFLPADFETARAPIEVEAYVFAEVAVNPGLHLREAEFVAGLAQHDAKLRGIVAHAPLELGAAVTPDLERLGEIDGVRGIRRLIQGAADPAFCLEPGFMEALRLLPKYRMSFDICVKHFAMVYALELVRRCPNVSFVLDHIGKPDIKNGLCEPWFAQIDELARMPNVVCKLSGVVTEADHANWSPDHLKPYVEHVLERFGFDRIMFGSDWTVSELTHRYPRWVEIVEVFIAGASEAEQRALFRETAIRTYRLAV